MRRAGTSLNRLEATSGPMYRVMWCGEPWSRACGCISWFGVALERRARPPAKECNARTQVCENHVVVAVSSQTVVNVGIYIQTVTLTVESLGFSVQTVRTVF